MRIVWFESRLVDILKLYTFILVWFLLNKYTCLFYNVYKKNDLVNIVDKATCFISYIFILYTRKIFIKNFLVLSRFVLIYFLNYVYQNTV